MNRCESGKEAYRYWSLVLEGESHVMSLHSEGVKTIFFCAIKIKNVRRYITTKHASYEALKMCISQLFFLLYHMFIEITK